MSRVYIYNEPTTRITFWDNNRDPKWEVGLAGGVFSADGMTYTGGTVKFRKVGSSPKTSFSKTCPTSDVVVTFSPVQQQ